MQKREKGDKQNFHLVNYVTYGMIISNNLTIISIISNNYFEQPA